MPRPGYSPPNSFDFFVAASTAAVRISCIFPALSAFMPSMVVPPGDVTISVSWAGVLSPLRQSLAAPKRL